MTNEQVGWYLGTNKASGCEWWAYRAEDAEKMKKDLEEINKKYDERKAKKKRGR